MDSSESQPNQPACCEDAKDAEQHYVRSRFTAHTSTADGNLVLYNSLTGHNCALRGSAGERVRPYLSKSGVSGKLDELGEYLLKKGYIVKSTTNEDAKWDLAYALQQYRPDVLQLTLLASEECNFRCIYCSQRFKRGSMRPEVRAGVKQLISKRVKKLTSLGVSWFGGEPLLGFDAIEDVAPYAKALASEHDVYFSSNMSTNGYLLTPDKSRKLVRWGVASFQITLDGTPSEHDARRPLKDGGPSFQKIMENVTAMKAFEEKFEVCLRVNFDHSNVHKLQPIFDDYQQRFGDDHRFRLRFRPVVLMGSDHDDQIPICQLREGIQHVMDLTDKVHAMGMATENLTEKWLSPLSSVCYAARPYHLVIGADGKVMKCTVVLDNDERNVVGNIGPDGEMNIQFDRLAAWVRPYYHHDAQCGKCFYLPVCQGVICAAPRVLSGQRPCPSQQQYIQRALAYAFTEKTRLGEHNLVRIQVPSPGAADTQAAAAEPLAAR